MKKLQLIVKSGGQRLDRYLSEIEHLATRSQIQRLIKAGLVVVDGRQVKPSCKLKGGESLSITIPDPEPTNLVPEDIPLDLVFEDEYLIVVNKPAGMVVHPGSGVSRGTLVNALLAHCKDLSGIGGYLRPGIVHRLDKGTSGLMVVAKDDTTHVKLSEALKERRIKRIYEAVVWGIPPEEGTVETLIGRSRADRKRMAVRKREGRTAVTTFKVIEEYGIASRLMVTLGTGRTHQIRVHLAHIGHPVFGDPTYGGRRRKYRDFSPEMMRQARQCLEYVDRQALHAKKLIFTHPISGSKIDLEAPVPDDMRALIEALERVSKGGKGED